MTLERKKIEEMISGVKNTIENQIESLRELYMLQGEHMTEAYRKADVYVQGVSSLYVSNKMTPGIDSIWEHGLAHDGD